MLQAKIAVIFSIMLLLLGSLLTRKVSAEEIVVSGNGSESANEVHQSTSNDTNVQSSNTTTVENNVQVDANTGGNTVSDNTNSTTDVTTGDVKTTTDITNAVNTSSVSTQNCCTEQGKLTIISGNGSNSQNTVTNQSSNSNSISVNQTANITNNIIVNANTGNNTVSGNNGDATVQTGSINVKQTIKNAPVNLTWISTAMGGSQQNKISIIGNGSGSVNTINFHSNNDINIDINNVANIFNNSLLNLNTGNNDVSDNLGDVTLITGDILIETEITNAVNAAKVDVTCGCKEKPQEQPAPVTPVQKVTPPSNESSSSSGGGNGEVAGIALGKVLPTTGTNWLFLAFISNVMMLFLGMILRLRSGNSPGAVAVA